MGRQILSLTYVRGWSFARRGLFKPLWVAHLGLMVRRHHSLTRNAPRAREDGDDVMGAFPVEEDVGGWMLYQYVSG